MHNLPLPYGAIVRDAPVVRAYLQSMLTTQGPEIYIGQPTNLFSQ